MRKFQLALLLLFTAACGSPADTDTGPESSEINEVAETDPSDESSPATNCPAQGILDGLEFPWEVRAGASFNIPATGMENLQEFRMELPGDWLIGHTDAHLHLRAPHVSRGVEGIRLSSPCGEDMEGVAERTAFVDVLPLELEATVTESNLPALEHAVAFADQRVSGDILVFGGFGFEPQQFTVTTDLWRYSREDAAWSSEPQTGDNPDATAGRVWHDAEEGVSYYHGGTRHGFSVSADLWRVWHHSPVRWEKMFAPNGPQNSLHAFFKDVRRNQLLSVCGFDGARAYCDVHSLNLSATNEGWTKRTILGGEPSSLLGFAWAYDRINDRLVIFGGDSTGAADTVSNVWALELSRQPLEWTRLMPGGDSHPSVRNPCWAHDPKSNRLFVWGGTPDARTTAPGLRILSLERGLEAWYEVETPSEISSRASCSGVYDAEQNRILMGLGFGGSTPLSDWAEIRL